MKIARARRLGTGLLLAGLLLLPAACSLYRNDRCWVPPEQYSLARDVFIQTGSLDLVRQRLEDLQWERAKINEALYRLQKEFEVLPEEKPEASAPAPLAVPASAPAATPPAMP
jgi:hypothetical protein